MVKSMPGRKPKLQWRLQTWWWTLIDWLLIVDHHATQKIICGQLKTQCFWWRTPKTMIQTPIHSNFWQQVEGNLAPISFPDNVTESTLEQVIRGADNNSFDGLQQKLAWSNLLAIFHPSNLPAKKHQPVFIETVLYLVVMEGCKWFEVNCCFSLMQIALQKIKWFLIFEFCVILASPKPKWRKRAFCFSLSETVPFSIWGENLSHLWLEYYFMFYCSVVPVVVKKMTLRRGCNFLSLTPL